MGGYDYSAYGEAFHPGAYHDIKMFIRDGIATVMISRPERKNGITDRVCHELALAFAQVDADPKVRCIIYASDPQSRVFSVGADLSGGGFGSSKSSGGGGGVAKTTSGHRDGGGHASLAVYRCKKPVIAALHGSAVGAGITISLAADVRIVAEDAKIGFPFVQRGITPEGCSSFFLPRLVGAARATEWMLTGDVFPARQAAGTGLFTKLVPAGEVYPEAVRIAQRIVVNCAPAQVVLTKKLLGPGRPSSAEEAHLIESRLQAWSFDQEDSKEGVKSYMQKRKPKWSNEGLPSAYPWWQAVETQSRL
eukprot:TRINITY_DN3397_c0_g2_i1.p1 TRINITY_DN3397_c0_g2~~TRINITY_DN3397_c0_g2_i1.p1  ORF type:complete len:306 (+),score=82.42 TRINITY_DN3397_c0_g2_i1:54-971(+)